MSGPWRSLVIPGNSLTRPWGSVADPWRSLAIRGRPWCPPDVLKILKHPGRSGEDRNPWLIRAVPCLDRG